MTPKRSRGRPALSPDSPTARITVRIPRALADRAAASGINAARVRELIVAELNAQAEAPEPETDEDRVEWVGGVDVAPRPHRLILTHALALAPPDSWPWAAGLGLVAPVSVTHAVEMTEADLRRWAISGLASCRPSLIRPNPPPSA